MNIGGTPQNITISIWVPQGSQILQLIQNALTRADLRTPLHFPIFSVLHSLHWLKIEQRIQYKIIFITTTYYTVLHLPISIVSSIFNPLVPYAPQTVFVWLILNSLHDSNSPIDLFVMLHLLFGTNYPRSFVSSPQKQLMPTQCHSHHLPYLVNNFLNISRHIFSLSPFLPRLPLFPLPSTFSTSDCPFLVILLSAREYTSISWFCVNFNLLLSIYLSIYLSINKHFTLNYYRLCHTLTYIISFNLIIVTDYKNILILIYFNRNF